MMYLGNNPVGLATSIPVFGDKINIEINDYTPTEDTLVSTVSFNHSLGVVPDFIYIYTDPISNGGEAWEKEYLLQSNVTNLLFLNDYGSDYYTFCVLRTKAGATTYSSTYGGITKSDFASPASFKIGISVSMENTTYFKANITYHYIIGKYKEVAPNA